MTKRDQLILLIDAWDRHSDRDADELLDAVISEMKDPGDGAPGLASDRDMYGRILAHVGGQAR